jgi:predicted phosphoadenosine phosphosulfate sulfurtransferase
MLNRVPGVATAWRYANTELFGTSIKPDHMSWQEYALFQLSNYSEPEIKREVADRIKGIIELHQSKTDDPIPEDDSHVLSGVSWKLLAKVAVKGDFKGRTWQSVANRAIIEREKRGVSFEAALEKHGSEAYKASLATR